mgnify:FL=1
MDLKAFEMAMAREMLFGLAVGLLALILSIWITYLVIKNAIRDGINESRLGDKWRASVASAQNTRDGLDMRAER